MPVELGKLVQVYCKVAKKGTTSITIDVRVTKCNMSKSDEVEVAKTTIVFVALDKDTGKPKAWMK